MDTGKRVQIDDVREKIQTDPRWTIRALMRLHELQTPTERETHIATYHNNVGFGRIDSEPLSHIAEKVESGESLTPAQIKFLQKRLPKYAAQLVRVGKSKVE